MCRLGIFNNFFLFSFSPDAQCIRHLFYVYLQLKKKKAKAEGKKVPR